MFQERGKFSVPEAKERCPVTEMKERASGQPSNSLQVAAGSPRLQEMVLRVEKDRTWEVSVID